MLDGVRNFTIYYYFDGVRSRATNAGHEEVKELAEKLSRGDFIDKQRRIQTQDSVEIGFHGRPSG